MDIEIEMQTSIHGFIYWYIGKTGSPPTTPCHTLLTPKINFMVPRTSWTRNLQRFRPHPSPSIHTSVFIRLRTDIRICIGGRIKNEKCLSVSSLRRTWRCNIFIRTTHRSNHLTVRRLIWPHRQIIFLYMSYMKVSLCIISFFLDVHLDRAYMHVWNCKSPEHKIRFRTQGITFLSC